MKKYFILLTILAISANLIFAQNRALDFNWDGTNYGLVDVNSTFGLSNNSVTIECWVNLPSTSEKGAFVSVGNSTGPGGGTTGNGYSIGVGSGDFNFAGNELIVIFNYIRWIPTGTNIGIGWHHVAFSINAAGTDATVYLDGALVGTYPDATAVLPPTNATRIGGTWGRAFIFLTDGYIDDVRFWNDVRTQTEIQDNHLHELTGTEDNLVAYYKFNQTTGAVVDDSGPNNYDGFFTTNATPTFNFDNSSVAGAGALPFYVDADVSGGDGASWATAYSSLQDALTNAVSGNVIWVAEGTYTPSVDETGNVNANTRLHTFQMIEGVEIYGGFAGTETATSQRTIGTNATILSGEIGTSSASDNCYHVFYHPSGVNLSSSAVLDGFTITRGYKGSYPYQDGAGMYNDGSSPTIRNCIVTDNIGSFGGGIFSQSTSTIEVINCTFTGNNGGSWGGAIENVGTSLTAKNCIFWNNTAAGAPEVYNGASNTAAFYNCNIEGGVASITNSTNEGGNIDSDPLFAGSKNSLHPYSLTGASPCADGGWDAANSEIYDIRGSDFGRKLDKADGTAGAIDMGAYEYKEGTDSKTVIYVDLDAIGSGNNGSSWADAFKTTTTAFQDALDAASSGNEIWVAAGTYKPSVDETGNVNADTRLHTFQMIDGVEIYGGFAGTETATSQRTLYGVGEANETILSGDIGTVDDIIDNCYHVFYHPAAYTLSNTAILNGFTITKGNASEASGDPSNGGGMYNNGQNGPDCTPQLIGCSFTNNNASRYGGALYNYYTVTPTISNCKFIGNTTTTNVGAAIYNSNLTSDLTISGCTFTSNTHGGAIYNYFGGAHTIIISNTSFTSNSSSLGGAAIYNYLATIEVDNCTFSNNQATENILGGAIYSASNLFTITDSEFSNNSSASLGGAIYHRDAQLLTISGTSFTSNTSTKGGAVYVSGSPATIDDCTFNSNSSTVYGGAIFNLTGNAPIIKNSVFWGNTATAGGNEVYNNNGGIPTFTNCDIEGSGGSSSWDTGLGIDGENNIDSDPLFVDAGSNDYRITGASP